jgi:hypothetical protein
MKKITSYRAKIILCMMLYGGVLALSYEFLSQDLTLPDRRTVLYDRLRVAGVLDAEADIREGRLVVKASGLPSDHISNFIILLKRRYGIIYQMVGGCISDPRAAVYWDAYNARSHDEIIKRYGIFVFQSVDTEAEELYKAGIDLSAQDSLWAEGEKFWLERDEPYTITVDSAPAFPENIFIKGASGSIDLWMKVSMWGTLTVERIQSIRIWEGPFSESYHWSGYGGNNAKQDSIKKNIQPWLDRYIASMQVKVNPKNYQWIYQGSVARGYTIEVGPNFFNQRLAIPHVPQAIAPASVAGPRDAYQVDITCYLDSSGTVKSWRFEWIDYWEYSVKAKPEDPYIHYSCIVKNFFDSSKVYNGDLFLVTRFTPWVKSVLAKTTLDVNRKNDYFKYFDLGGVAVTLEKKKQFEGENNLNPRM